MSILVVLIIMMLSTDAQDTSIPFLDASSNAGCPSGQALLENECVNVPKLVKRKVPVYPELARRAKVQATVELMAVIQPDGTIGDITVIKPTGLPQAGFEDAAIKAVKKWRYEPVILHGKPVPVRFKVKVEFFLS